MFTILLSEMCFRDETFSVRRPLHLFSSMENVNIQFDYNLKI